MTAAAAAHDGPGRRERIAWSLAIFAVALALRAVVLGQLTGSVLLDAIIGDAANYDRWAREVAAGDWLGSEVFYQAPLYPYFLGTSYVVSGGDVLFARCVQVLLGSASCALLALAGFRFLSLPAGVGAGLLLACYPPAIVADVEVGKSVLDLFFVCLSLFLLGGMLGVPRRGAGLALGVTLGLLILTRENALALLPVLAGWLALRPGGAGHRAGLVGAFALGVALVLTPVALRNWHVGGGFHLTTSQLGHNLYIGNNENADGTYAPLVPRRGQPRIERQDAIDIAERALGRPLSASEVSDYYTGLALRYVRSQPLDWLALMARKLLLTFNAVEVVDTKDHYAYEDLSPVLGVLGRLLHFGVLLPLALLGAWLTWRERARLAPLYLILLVYTATLLVFYVFARYRLPMAPVLSLFAAAGVLRLPAVLRGEGAARALAPAGLAVLAAAVFCNWPVLEADYMRSVTQYNLGNGLAAAGRAEEAMARYRSAIAFHERNALAHHNLGALLASRGDLEEARAHYERALAIDPSYHEARYHLALTHLDLGLAREAGGDLAGARRSYERALAIEPRLAEAEQALARLAESAGLP